MHNDTPLYLSSYPQKNKGIIVQTKKLESSINTKFNSKT